MISSPSSKMPKACLNSEYDSEDEAKAEAANEEAAVSVPSVQMIIRQIILYSVSWLARQLDSSSLRKFESVDVGHERTQILNVLGRI